jgi:hypothetical protein
MNVEKALRQLAQDPSTLQLVVKEMKTSGLNHLKRLMAEAKHVFSRANGSRKDDDDGEGKALVKLGLVFDLMIELLMQLQAGDHSVNLQDLRDWSNEILGEEFNSLEAKVTRPVWVQLKSVFISELLVWVKTLVEIAGGALGLPVFLMFLEELFVHVSDVNDPAVECLTACLYSVGALASPLALQYIKKVELIAAIRAKLVMLQTSDTVTLEPAKKLRTRKVGNSHQTRRHKVMMRRDEKRKLSLLGPRQPDQHGVDLLSLKLQFQCKPYSVLGALIATRQPVDLTDLVIVDLDKLDPFVLKPLLRALYLQAQLDSSHKHFTQQLLQKLRTRRTFRVLASECKGQSGLFCLNASSPI